MSVTCANTTCLCCTFLLLVPRYIWVICSEGRGRITCFTTCFRATASPTHRDSRRSEGESGGQHTMCTPAMWRQKQAFFFFFKRLSRNVTVHLLKDVSVWFCQVWKVWCLVSVCVLGQQYDKTEAGLCLTAPLLHPVRAQNMSHTIHPLVLTSYGHPTHVDQGHSRHSDGPVI